MCSGYLLVILFYVWVTLLNQTRDRVARFLQIPELNKKSEWLYSVCQVQNGTIPFQETRMESFCSTSLQNQTLTKWLVSLPTIERWVSVTIDEAPLQAAPSRRRLADLPPPARSNLLSLCLRLATPHRLCSQTALVCHSSPPAPPPCLLVKPLIKIYVNIEQVKVYVNRIWNIL
jgi:hypothetical protein